MGAEKLDGSEIGSWSCQSEYCHGSPIRILVEPVQAEIYLYSLASDRLGNNGNTVRTQRRRSFDILHFTTFYALNKIR